MAPSRAREKTPDNDTIGELKSRFFAILKDATIEQRIGQQVLAKYKQLQQEKVILEGDPMEWLVPGAFALAIAQKLPGSEPKILLTKLLKTTGLNIPNFYIHVRKWVDIISLPGHVRDVVSQAERYFQIARTIFERYDQMFLSVFRDPVDPDGTVGLSPTGDKTASLRRRQKVVPGLKVIQPVDIYIFTWDLFIRLRRSAPAVRDDLVVSYHLLMCVMDLVCLNVLGLNRSELRNRECTILPPAHGEIRPVMIKLEDEPQPLEETTPVAPVDSDPVVKEEPKSDPPKVSSAPVSSSVEGDSKFSLLPYLCASFDGIYRDCLTLYINGFLPIVDQFLRDKELLADRVTYLGLMTPENYEKNLYNINGEYERLTRAASAADERLLLVARDISSPGAGLDPGITFDVLEVMKERRDVAPVVTRKLESVDFKTPTPVLSLSSNPVLSAPLTPTSSCSALERREAQASQKTPALQTAVDLVTKLTTLCAGCTNTPSSNLASILSALYDKDVAPEFAARSSEYREKLVQAYSAVCDESGLAEPYIRQRFVFGEIWYYKLLEDVLVSEKNRVPYSKERMKKLTDNLKFQKSIFALAIDMVLYSYNCSKMFPWPLEVLGVAPYDFVKIIEPVVHLEPLPRSLIKHFSSIEESVLEQLVWRSDSPLWTEIGSEPVLPVREVCWPHSLEEDPTTDPAAYTADVLSPVKRRDTRLLTPPQPGQIPVLIGVPTGNDQRLIINQNGISTVEDPPSPARPVKSTAVCLFFRKVYVLAGARLREMCDKLGFDTETEKTHHVFQRMFTLLEHVLTEHTLLLKDRHLDQILMCCAYVVAKLEAGNGLDRSFHQIMHAYRSQPQAESRVYRSVLIEVDSREKTEEKKPAPSHHGTRSKSNHAVTPVASTAADMDGVAGERGDIIKFYNKVFVRSMQTFIAKCSPKKKAAGGPGVLLSPVPRVQSTSIARRQIHPQAPVYVSPLKREIVYFPSPVGGRVLQFTFGVSTKEEPGPNGQAAANGEAGTANVTVIKRENGDITNGNAVKKIRRTGTLRALPRMGQRKPEPVSAQFPVMLPNSFGFSTTNPAEGIPPPL